MNVLLISPRLSQEDRRYMGDHAYTDILLSHPPESVQYFHYQDLIASGQVRRIRFLPRIGQSMCSFGILPPDLWMEYLDCQFLPDMIHIYGFSVMLKMPQVAQKVPIILSNGTGGISDLKYYHQWLPERIYRMRKLKRWYLKLLGAHDSSLAPEKAAMVLVWSQFSRSLHLEEGYISPEKIHVLYPGLPASTRPVGENRKPLTFLFIGGNFERKNGPIVLEAFKRVHIANPNTALIIVSQPSDGHCIQSPGVEHHLFLSRKTLFEVIYPKADVLLLPSLAEGFGLVMLEALSLGIPVIASNIGAIPEIIQEGYNGFLISPKNLDSLVRVMNNFADGTIVMEQMRQNCLEVFHKQFSIQSHNSQLKEFYDQAYDQTLR